MAESKCKVAKPSVGIDLGTSYSCVAVFQNGKPEVIANSQGNRITPSVVAFTKDGRLIGEGAEIQRKLDPPNAIYNAKRFIGRTWDDPVIQENRSMYPFKVLEKDNKLQFAVSKSSETVNVTPEEIAAAILSKLKKVAEDYLEETVEDVVITVPAYFTDSQRQATKNAGMIAGLNVARIINEPTAAAMAYGFREGTKEDDGKHILVYDIGGGTFDVSVLEIEEDLIQVKATAGNTDLGGEDFNDLLLNYFKQEIFKKHKFDLTSNSKALRRLTGACEKLKRNLSAENISESKLELDNFLPNGKDFASTLSRAKFENLCKKLFDETIKCVEKALADARLSTDDIDEVVLVGGSSRIPKLQSMLSNFFNHKSLNKSINPDEAVACGAAVQAAIINNDPNLTVKDMLLMDVIPLSIGVANSSGTTDIILERNTTIPVRKTTHRYTASNDQKNVLFRITEGERVMVKDNRILGSFRIYGLPPRKAGDVGFDMEFEIDQCGILTVSATVRGTNQKAGITLDQRSSGKLSDEEVKRLVKEAEMMKFIDQNEDNRMLAKNKLVSLCNHISYVSQDLPKTDIADVMKAVSDCLAWINENPDAKEDKFNSKYAVLNDKAKDVLNMSKIEKTERSSHVLRMGKQKAKFCMQEGRTLLMSDIISDKVEAAEYFLKAYRIASEGGNHFKEIEALVQYGQTSRILAATVTDSKSKLNHALETARSLSYVLGLEKNKMLSDDERKTVIRDIQFATDEVFKNIEVFDDDEKFHFLDLLMRSLNANNITKGIVFSQIMFRCRIKELNMFVEKIGASLSMENVKDAHKYIQILNYPKEQAKLFAKSPEEKQQLAKLLEVIQGIMLQAEGLKQINLAAALLDGVDVDHPDNIDKALMALDHLSDAKQLTEKIHPQVYIKAKFVEGKIFMDYLKNASKAKTCFQKVVVASEQNDFNTGEYRQSKYILEDIQKEQRKEQEAGTSVSKEAIMNELQQDIQNIQQADNSMSDEDFVNFLLSQYPPKHKESYKNPVLAATGSMKKAYIRLSMFYHPDKVDASQHGEKYKALCGEISKYVNGRFLKM